MRKRLQAVWVIFTTWGPCLLITMLFGSLGALASILRIKSVARRCIHWWGTWNCWALQIKPQLSQSSQADWAGQLTQLKQGVMIANHASNLDIIIIAALAPFDIRILAKYSLFKIPCLGWYLSACGHIPVYRGAQKHLNETKGRQAIQKALDEGATLFFFPEGTRSKDGQLKPFKSGAFIAAEQHQLITYPIVVSGTSQLLRSGSRLIHHDPLSPCAIHFLPELESIQNSVEENLDFKVRVQMAKERAEQLYQESFTQD